MTPALEGMSELAIIFFLPTDNMVSLSVSLSLSYLNLVPMLLNKGLDLPFLPGVIIVTNM